MIVFTSYRKSNSKDDNVQKRVHLLHSATCPPRRQLPLVQGSKVLRCEAGHRHSLHQQFLTPPPLLLILPPPSDEILLLVFTGHGLGAGLVVEGEFWDLLLLHSFHLLTSIRLFSPVEEAGGDGQAGHHHEDDQRYHTWWGGGTEQ